MTCEHCTNASTRHSPACAQCFVRLIAAIRSCLVTRDEKQARMRAALETWVKWGHDKQELRTLAMGAKRESGNRGR